MESQPVAMLAHRKLVAINRTFDEINRQETSGLD